MCFSRSHKHMDVYSKLNMKTYKNKLNCCVEDDKLSRCRLMNRSQMFFSLMSASVGRVPRILFVSHREVTRSRALPASLTMFYFRFLFFRRTTWTSWPSSPGW